MNGNENGKLGFVANLFIVAAGRERVGGSAGLVFATIRRERNLFFMISIKYSRNIKQKRGVYK